MTDIESNIQNKFIQDLQDRIFPHTKTHGVTSEQLYKFYDIWQNHGVTIATILNNYRDGKTTKEQTIKLLHPYTSALITVHDVATTIMCGGQ